VGWRRWACQAEGSARSLTGVCLPVLRTLALKIALACGLWLALAAPAVRAAPGPATDPSTALLGRPQVQWFTDREGLRQNSVEAVATDDQGYAWIATQDGAMRYNGRSWVALDMPDPHRSNWITCMVLPKGGPRWFGTNNAGIARWDGTWTTFDTSRGLPSDSIYSLAEGAGTLWAGTARGPARWMGERWKTLGTGPWQRGPVRALLVRGRGASLEVWAGTDEGLGLWRQGQWRWFGPAEGLPHRMVTALLPGDEPGELWVGTQGGLLVGAPSRWRRQEGLPHPAVSCLARTLSREGRPVLWVGTEGGLLRWEGGRGRIWGQTQGLASPVVRSLLVQMDPSGRETIWVGTFGGLVRFTEGTWTSLETQDGLPDNLVFSFHEEGGRGSLWLGTFHGLVSFREGRWRQFGPAEGLPRTTVFALAGDVGDGALWVGTRAHGLYRLSGGRARSVPGLPDSFVYALHSGRDPDGEPVLWVGTRAGLSKWRGGAWTHFSPRENVPSVLVSAITETKAPDGSTQIWVGTRGAGLGVLEAGHKAFTWFDGSKGLVDPKVMHLLATQEDGRQVLWVSTQAGLQKFRTSPAGPTDRVLSMASNPALPGDMVYTAQRGPDGSLYAFTNRGVWCLGPKPGGGWEAQTFTTGDGLPSNGCVQGASLVDSRGRIWAGTVRGLAILDPTARFVDTQAKPLYLDEARNAGRLLPTEGPWHLSWRRRNLKVRFSLLSYHREADTRFRSQLVGLEAEPTAWVPDAEREFVGLAAGRYRLRFWGRDHAGNVSGPREVLLTVEAPPWLRWWAVMGYAVLGALAVLGVILWQVRRLQRRNEVLQERVHLATAEIRRQNESLGRVNQHLGRLHEEKSMMLGIAAHDLRNPLTNIGLVAERLLRRGQPEATEAAAQQILKQGKDMAQLIERLLNSSRIDAGHLSLHMEAVAPEILFKELVERHRPAAEAKGLVLVLDLPQGGVPDLLADPFHLVEALDNLVSNAMKFMPQGPPLRQVVLRARPGIIEVQDDGPGFTDEDKAHAFERFRRLSAKPTAGESSTGLGLSIVKALVEAMGGEIELQSEPGRGSTFRIHLGLA